MTGSIGTSACVSKLSDWMEPGVTPERTEDSAIVQYWQSAI